jgi:hypothetical protein
MKDEEEYEKIDKQEAKLLAANEDVKKLIASANKIHKVIRIGDINVRIRAFMPRGVRLKVLKAGTILKKVKTDEDVLNADKLVYPIIAEMCLDFPYNKAKTWEDVDEKTGVAQKVLLDIMEVVNSTEKSIETFRPVE